MAMLRSTARTTSTDAPFRSMIAIDRSASPCVCDRSGERLRVELTERPQVGEVPTGLRTQLFLLSSSRAIATFLSAQISGHIRDTRRVRELARTKESPRIERGFPS